MKNKDETTYVRYIEGCSPRVRSFANKEEANRFMVAFVLTHQNKNTDDNWIDMVFTGNIMFSDVEIEVSHVKTR